MAVSLQQVVSDFNSKHEIKIEPDARVLDLNSEVGEISKLSFKTKVGEPVRSLDWQEEIGDALYSILSLSSTLNINAETALKEALLKYAGRIKRNGNMQSGDQESGREST